MANTSAPFGFQQWSGTGSTPTYEQVAGPIAFDNTTKIYAGDPVSTDPTTGNIVQATAGTAPLAGVFVGCKYNSVSRNGQPVYSPYWPGADAISGSVEGYYINDPNAIFEVQSTGASPVAQANSGENIQFALGTGNTSTGQSGASVTFASLATTATLPFKVIKPVIDPPGVNGRDVTSANNVILVRFNNVDTKTLTGIA
ncbi:hypothetical protein OIU35_31580 [Boseaceae bacterium BT-24-1]|nr:hypothetical protein [Boseaceae bacterium BT-24-1]